MGNVENAISEPLDFKIFLEEHAPRLPYKPCTFATHFLVTPLIKICSGCCPRQWSPGLPFLCQYTHGINTHSKRALMLNKFGMKSS